ncbi:hypothetical protein KF728_21365 [Candidatus Obscuribacterales bacterium]|nr:hypothetical protein [Candidatus Obscuribacterales bacterium]
MSRLLTPLTILTVMASSISSCAQTPPDKRDLSIELSKSKSIADIERLKVQFLAIDPDEKHFAKELEWAAVRKSQNERFEPIDVSPKRWGYFLRLVRPATDKKTDNQDRAKLLLSEALKIRVNNPDELLPVLRINLGQTKIEAEDYAGAESLLEQARKEISGSELFDNLNLNVLLKNRVGTLYMRTNRLTEAQNLLQPLESICNGTPPKRNRNREKGAWNQSSPNFPVQIETLEVLSELSERQGDLKKALQLQRKVVATIRSDLEEEARVTALVEGN